MSEPPHQGASHVESRLSLHIRRLMYTSVLLCLIVLGADGSLIFSASLFTSPAATILTLAHHITILILAWKQHQRLSSKDGIPLEKAPPKHILPVVAQVGTIICGWLLWVLWLGVTGILTWCMIFNRMNNSLELMPLDYPFEPWLVGLPISLGASVIQLGVLFTICLFCTRERRSLVLNDPQGLGE